MNEENIDFEKSMQELEKIVSKLESGKLNLDESVNEFEKGMKLAKECSKILECAEKRITILLQDGEKLNEENFTA